MGFYDSHYPELSRDGDVGVYVRDFIIFRKNSLVCALFILCIRSESANALENSVRAFYIFRIQFLYHIHYLALDMSFILTLTQLARSTFRVDLVVRPGDGLLLLILAFFPDEN